MIEALALTAEPAGQTPGPQLSPAEAAGTAAGGPFATLLLLLQATAAAAPVPGATPESSSPEADSPPADGSPLAAAFKQPQTATGVAPEVASQLPANTVPIVTDLPDLTPNEEAASSNDAGSVEVVDVTRTRVQQPKHPARIVDPAPNPVQATVATPGSRVEKETSTAGSVPAERARVEKGVLRDPGQAALSKPVTEEADVVRILPVSTRPLLRPATALADLQPSAPPLSKVLEVAERDTGMPGPLDDPETVNEEVGSDSYGVHRPRVRDAGPAVSVEREVRPETLRSRSMHVVRPVRAEPEEIERSAPKDAVPDSDVVEETPGPDGNERLAETADRPPARAEESPLVTGRAPAARPMAATFVRPEDALVPQVTRPTVRPPAISEAQQLVLDTRGPSDVPGLPNETVRGVRFLLANGEHSLRIRLVPQSLGEVHLEVSTTQGEVAVKLASGNASVRDALQNSVAHLRETLVQDGHRVMAVTVSAELPSQFGWGHGERHPPPPPSPSARYGPHDGRYPPGQETGDQSRPDPRHAQAWHGKRLNLLV